MSLDKAVECPICLTIKRDKNYFSCIKGHSLCQDCYHKIQNEFCPTCRQGFCSPPTRNFTIENLILESKYITLPCNNDNCDFTATRIDIEKHETEECPELELSCCNVNYLKKFHDGHMSDYHDYRCPINCGFSGTKDELEAHENVCLDVKVSCPNCAITIVRSLVSQHYHKMHLPCQNIGNDCRFSGTMKELKQHNQSCVEVLPRFWKSPKLTSDTHPEIWSLCGQSGSVYVGLMNGLLLKLNSKSLKVEEKIVTGYNEGIAIMDSDESLLVTASRRCDGLEENTSSVFLWSLQSKAEDLETVAFRTFNHSVSVARVCPEFILIGAESKLLILSRSDLSEMFTIEHPWSTTFSQYSVAQLQGGCLIMAAEIGLLKVLRRNESCLLLHLPIHDKRVRSIYPFTNSKGETFLAIGYEAFGIQILNSESQYLTSPPVGRGGTAKLKVVSEFVNKEWSVLQIEVDFMNRIVLINIGYETVVFELNEDCTLDVCKTVTIGNWRFSKMENLLFYADYKGDYVSARSIPDIKEVLEVEE